MSENNPAAQILQPQQLPNVVATEETLCDNFPVTPTPITTGVIAKIPVVLAELTVQINLDSLITLPVPAIEIKRVGKRLKLTQCLLLQNTNKLYLRGFVRKNIEFSSLASSTPQGICGPINHCTVDVPFSCVTPVVFNVTPPEPANFNTVNQFEYFKTQDLPPEFPEKDQLLSGDLSEFNQVSTEFFNVLPFCQLICATITEFNETLGRTRPPGITPLEEFQFISFEEKMVIELTLKILQERQVAIPAIPTNT